MTASRRVLLQRPAGRDQFGSRSAEPEAGNVDTWIRRRKGAASRTRMHPIVRLTEAGIDWGTAPQNGDEIGYAVDPARTDECLAAAIATVTQIPMEQVPDLALDRRLRRGEDPDEISRTSWERLDRWACQRGLQMMFSSDPPLSRRRWIGVCFYDARLPSEVAAFGGELSDVARGTHFNDHCLVMAHDRLLFDPSCSVKVPPGTRLMTYRPHHISYGLCFDTKEE